ncbi:MAG: transglutaminase-like domain-containing protein [Leptonema sp. (in: bacteria)]
MQITKQNEVSLNQEDYQNLLKPTYFFDYNTPTFEDYFQQFYEPKLNSIENLKIFYYQIRDGILYNPYSFKIQKKYYKASYILKQKKSFCIPKAILFSTVARRLGIPSKIGFSDVKNHLSSQRFLEYLNSDVFAFHGYCEVFISKENSPYLGKWIKVTPAFDKELCSKFNVEPLKFDGKKDSIFQPYNFSNKKFMEYIRDRGSFPDFPYNYVINGLLDFYPFLKKKQKLSGDIRKEI